MVPPGGSIESWTPDSRSGRPGIDTTPGRAGKFRSVEVPALLPQNRQALEAEAQKRLELPLDPNFGAGTGRRFRAGDDGQGTGVVVDLIGADPEPANGSFDVAL